MTKQKKLAEAEEYDTPLDTLLSFLRVPHKIYRSIYISIIERRLSSKPLLQNDATIAFLARKVGVEPDLMAEKIRSMVRMKWIEFKQVGERDTNQIFVISPIWRYKPGIDKAKFAVALQQYKAGIVEDKECQMSTEEIYELMNSVCLHTETRVDPALCQMARWQECKICSHRDKKCNPKGLELGQNRKA
jgi:hypothetical protein